MKTFEMFNDSTKKAYLVKLTDADGDVCAFLIDEETAENIDNDIAVSIPGTNQVLDGDSDSYERWYAKIKDINEIIENAKNNGYIVDLDNEFDFIHY